MVLEGQLYEHAKAGPRAGVTPSHPSMQSLIYLKLTMCIENRADRRINTDKDDLVPKKTGKAHEPG